MSSLLMLLLLWAGGDLAAAQKALRADRPREAIRLLGDLAHGSDPQANVVLGRAYYALREYEAAVEPLLTASDALTGDKELARMAAYACWGSARSRDRFARAYLDDAIRMAERAGDPMLQATLEREAGNFERALKLYRELADGLSVRFGIARCLEGLGREQEAPEAYAAALDEAMRRKDLEIAYKSAFKAGRAGQLLKWLGDRIRSEKEAVWLHLYRGYAYADMNLHREAVEDLRIAAKARPNDLRTKGRLCSSLLSYGAKEQRRKALDEAEAVARDLLGRDAGNPRGLSAMRWLAWYAWANRDVEQAYRRLAYLHQLDPGGKDDGLNFAAMARRLGRYAEAKVVYDRLLESDDSDPDVLNDLGILYDGKGDRVRAVETWRRALKEDPEDLNALENLFTASWERGDRTAMSRLLERGLALARERGGGLLDRWNWFADRLAWAPLGHGG